MCARWPCVDMSYQHMDVTGTCPFCCPLPLATWFYPKHRQLLGRLRIHIESVSCLFHVVSVTSNRLGLIPSPCCLSVACGLVSFQFYFLVACLPEDSFLPACFLARLELTLASWLQVAGFCWAPSYSGLLSVPEVQSYIPQL